MNKILSLTILLSFSPLAQAKDAVAALKSYIPFFEHHGVNDRYQRCSLDIYRKPGGAVMVDFISGKIYKFLVTPELSYKRENKYLKISQPSFPESGGEVTMSLVFEEQTVKIERLLCVEDRCWSSTMECSLDRW